MNKKIKIILTAFVSTIMLLGCNSEPASVTAVKNFLDANHIGDYQKSLTYLGDELTETFTATYSYEDFFDTSSIDEEAKGAVSKLISSTLKASCVNYTVGEATKENDSTYKVQATIEYIDMDSLDTSEIEDSLLEEYQITEDMVRDLDEDALGNLLVKNIALYSSELMEYGIKNGETTSAETTFVVEKKDNKWVITSIE